jgi:hypothetical protein
LQPLELADSALGNSGFFGRPGGAIYQQENEGISIYEVSLQRKVTLTI